MPISYTRGTDLSATPDGAGGIGGLLARSHGYSSGSWTNHNMYHADGNGNVTAMVGANQTLVASYRYDPYGRPTYTSGTLATANVYRFSSKPIHVNSGLYYYGYRFYYPELQRWVNRDPWAEEGGVNLYQFVQNSPLSWVDRDGLDIWRIEYPDFPYHEIIIGNNPDGGYWMTDFGPTGGRALTAPGQYGYTSNFSPDLLPEGSRVITLVKTTCDVDRALRDRAANDASQPAPRYWCLGRNCWSYAEGFVDEARRRMGYGPPAPIKGAPRMPNPPLPPRLPDLAPRLP